VVAGAGGGLETSLGAAGGVHGGVARRGAGIPCFLFSWLSAKTIRERAIKIRRVFAKIFASKSRNRFKSRSIAARAAQKPFFCAKPWFLRSKFPKLFFSC